LVVGGGSVAERKIATLIEGGADVVVVSPKVTDKVKQWALSGQITWISREYVTSDGEGVFLVIAATNLSEVNKKVYQDANQRGQWINVVDQPELCNFTVPSMVRRGKLQIAISTSGASPSLSKKIRQELEKNYGDEYEYYLDILQEVREKLQHTVTSPKLRYTIMKELVNEKWIELCRNRPLEARRKIESWVQHELLESTGKGGNQ
jgi:precorrin-2 dehydrogenase/sirohydrochlorin ferrochelatase